MSCRGVASSIGARLSRSAPLNAPIVRAPCAQARKEPSQSTVQVCATQSPSSKYCMRINKAELAREHDVQSSFGATPETSSAPTGGYPRPHPSKAWP